MILKAEMDTMLIDLLLKAFPESNHTRLKKAIRFGCVSCDGALLKHPQVLLHKGQVIDFKKYQAREDYKEKAPFKILFEDEDMLVVYKPAGVLSSGTTTEKIRSMFGMVNSYVIKKSRQKCRAHTVHRLDREVCGLMIFTKNEESKLFFQENWKQVDKRYYAVVEGRPQKKSGTLSSYLKENVRQVVFSVPEEEQGAKWAVTHYRELQYDPDTQTTLLDVELETGRKNQIRVHLSEMGCPIVGDRKYGADASEKRPIHLVAYFLSFPHPITHRREEVEIALPKDFAE